MSINVFKVTLSRVIHKYEAVPEKKPYDTLVSFKEYFFRVTDRVVGALGFRPKIIRKVGQIETGLLE